MEKIKCPECGCDISRDAVKCPFCDFVIKEENTQADNNYTTARNGGHGINRKIIGIVAIIASIVLFTCAFARINNSDYKFYKEHYEDCMEGYDDSKYSARTEGLLFSGAYNMIADKYQDMALEDKEKLDEFKLQAGILGTLGGILLIGGFVFAFKKEIPV